MSQFGEETRVGATKKEGFTQLGRLELASIPTPSDADERAWLEWAQENGAQAIERIRDADGNEFCIRDYGTVDSNVARLRAIKGMPEEVRARQEQLLRSRAIEDQVGPIARGRKYLSGLTPQQRQVLQKQCFAPRTLSQAEVAIAESLSPRIVDAAPALEEAQLAEIYRKYSTPPAGTPTG